MAPMICSTVVGRPKKGPFLSSGKKGKLHGPDKYRVLVGWIHQREDVESLEEGQIYGWVSAEDHFEVYSTSSNRGLKGEVVDCGRINFAMIRSFHPYWCAALGGRVPRDRNSEDKRLMRNAYREFVRLENERRRPRGEAAEDVTTEEQANGDVAAEDEPLFYLEEDNPGADDRDPSPEDILHIVEEILALAAADTAPETEHLRLPVEQEQQDRSDRQTHDPGYARDDEAVFALADEDAFKREPRFIPAAYIDLTVRHVVDLTNEQDTMEDDEVIFVKEEIEIKDEKEEILTPPVASFQDGELPFGDDDVFFPREH